MKFLHVIYMTVLVVGLAVGCVQKAEQTGSGAAAKPKAKLRLAFVTNNATDFWAIARAGCEKAVELPNVTLEFRIPVDATSATQKRIGEDLLKKLGLQVSGRTPLR